MGARVLHGVAAVAGAFLGTSLASRTVKSRLGVIRWGNQVGNVGLESTRSRRAFSMAAIGSILLAVGCGKSDDAKDGRPEPTSVQSLYDASPAPGVPGRGGLPQDANTGSVTIKNGKIDPDTIDTQVGLPYILTVTSDGQPHRIGIEGLVTAQQVKAQGDTLVQMNIPEGADGEKDILIDGKKAGTLRVTGAGGAVNP